MMEARLRSWMETKLDGLLRDIRSEFRREQNKVYTSYNKNAELLNKKEEKLDSPAAMVRACYDGYQACAHGDDGKGALAWLTRVYDYTRQSDLEGSRDLKELESAIRQMKDDQDDDDDDDDDP